MTTSTTRFRAGALAQASAAFPELSPPTCEDLLELVRVELGHEEILDGFRPYSHAGRAWARSPRGILHILAGNTPAAGLQSLITGLLLGAENRVKLPSGGLPELTAFCDQLKPELTVQLSETLEEGWLDWAEAILVYGDDETVARFRAKARPDQKFHGFGHRNSFGIVLEDPKFESVTAAARDISLFNQKGCLSPHDLYIREIEKGIARTYARHLANAMETYNREHPRGPVTVREAAEIQHLRSGYRFRASADPTVEIFESRDSTDWTVIYEEEPDFAVSCLNRVVFVKPLPDDLPGALQWVAPHLSTVGLWPCRAQDLRVLTGLAVPRICPLGKMQQPPWTWHHDGLPRLAGLVEWVDWEPS